MATTTQDLCQMFVRGNLFSDEEMRTLRQAWHTEAGAAAEDGERFTRWLVGKRQLSEFQVAVLARGSAEQLFLGPYKLVDRIGTGRMAGVYKAVHNLGQTVAIKVLPPSKAKDATALGRFQREARLALKLKHPNIVRTFQAGKTDTLNYLVMEYLDGETFEDVLKRRGRLPPLEAVRVVFQAMSGLQHLNEQGMIHRDLKPANLMLVPAAPAGGADTTAKATVKILDIGVGRALFDEGDPEAQGQQDLTNQGDVLGSPDYLAPEQAIHAHAADIRSDIYSLGCVLYHALTGQPPFPDSNPVRKIMRHAKEAPKPIRELGVTAPPELQAALDRMLAKDPALRFATPAAAVQALQGVLTSKGEQVQAESTEQPVSAYEVWLEKHDPDVAAVRAVRRPVPVSAPARPNFARRRLVAALTGAGVVLLGLVTWMMIALSRGGREPAPAPGPGPDGGAPITASMAEWIREVAVLPAAKQVERVAAKLKELNPGFDGQVKELIESEIVLELEFSADQVSDISPVQALTELKRLGCAGSGPGKGKLASLAPLRGMSLGVLDVGSTKVTDLTPLAGMPLVYLGISGTQVRDLTPLKDCRLQALDCTATLVKNLAPLRGMPLSQLDADGAPVDDLAPLLGMPLETLRCDNLKPQRDARLLRTIATLQEINGKPAAEIFKVAEAQDKTQKTWAQKVASQSPKQQVDAVKAELKARNPDFDGTVEYKIDDNKKVVELRFVSDAIVDVSPIAALKDLKRLDCNGSAPGKGKLANLEPLKTLKLSELDCGWSQVADLTPLKDMPLRKLSIAGATGVTDLTPLSNLTELTYILLDGNEGVNDLTPLMGTKLSFLNVAGTQVDDLEPLKKLKLQTLMIHGTRVAGLRDATGLPLKTVSFDFQPNRDTDVLRAFNGLERVNNKLVTDFWTDVDARQQEFDAYVKRVRALPADEQPKAVAAELQKRNSGYDGAVTPTIRDKAVIELKLPADRITDLTPVRALPALAKLSATGTSPGQSKLADVWPLKGLKLTALTLNDTAVSDLTPLAGMPLDELNLANTPVYDLGLVDKMPLKRIDLTGTRINDLTPLADLKLHAIKGNFNADELKLLRGIKSLATINGKSTLEASATTRVAAAPKEQLKPTVRFAGKLVKINRSDNSLTVQITRPVITIDAYQAQCILYHEMRIATVSRTIKNPVERMRSLQRHMTWIAFHRSFLYHRHDRRQNVHFLATDDMKIRTTVLPPMYDGKGNVRKPSPQELKDLKGADGKLPGYTSDFRFLQTGQFVELYLETSHVARPKGASNADAPPDQKAIDPRPRVVMAVIVG